MTTSTYFNNDEHERKKIIPLSFGEGLFSCKGFGKSIAVHIVLLLVMVSHHYCGDIGKSIGVGIGNGIISLLWGFEQKYWRKHSVGIGYMVLVLVSAIVKVLESQ